jgi:hypothetical protein
MELTSSLTHTVHTQVETVKENENKQGEGEEEKREKKLKIHTPKVDDLN